jgi:hygromycin-B 4-O-kinase
MIGQLIGFLRQHVHPSCHSLIALGAGMFSQAYRFEADDGLFVLRIGVTYEAFEKDKLAYERLGYIAPIPEILAIDAYDDTHYYCISTWFPGQILTNFNKTQTEKFLPSLFGNLLAISRVPMPVETGFGILNGEGKARWQYDTWADFIGASDDFYLTFTPRGNEVYKPWTELLATTFLDTGIVLDARQQLVDLLPLLPNERHYVHGDFGYENALADGHQLTAILDWAELRCGDWLYDLAYITYYDDLGTDYLNAFTQFAIENALVLPNFQARIRAYFLHIFLGNIFLEANRGQRDWYQDDLLRYKRLILNANL